ncbi:MAG: peptidase S53, partial [Steroidobacteraceae bacterium]
MARRPLRGSERNPLPDSRTLGPSDPTERLEVTIVVRGADSQALKDRLDGLARGERSIGHLSRADFARRHGASRADLDAVRDF